MILHYIPKDQLRQYWNFVKQGLEIVRSKGHSEWIVEDVYCDCYENRSMLFVAIQDGRPFGFVVLQPINNALHVWAAWSNLHDKNIIDICFEEIKEIAINGYKEKVTFTSQRRGWERNARKMGFVPSTWEYKLNG